MPNSETDSRFKLDSWVRAEIAPRCFMVGQVVTYRLTDAGQVLGVKVDHFAIHAVPAHLCTAAKAPAETRAA